MRFEPKNTPIHVSPDGHHWCFIKGEGLYDFEKSKRPSALYLIAAASLAVGLIPFTFTTLTYSLIVAAAVFVTGCVSYWFSFIRNKDGEGYLGPRLFPYVRKNLLHCGRDNRSIHEANSIDNKEHPIFVEIISDLLDEWYRDTRLTYERAKYYTQQLELLGTELAKQDVIKRKLNMQSKKTVNYSENLKYETEQLQVALTASTTTDKLTS